jgi:2-amino-4-hydroxy-6-hydroxymethyldihydropteridine diphosphokinase
VAFVLLGIGSNIDRQRSIASGLDALQDLFGEMSLSSVYDTESIGFNGQPFLNLVVEIETDWTVAHLVGHLRAIEFAHGRPANPERGSPRQLDIDILTYDVLLGCVAGVELPRGEILENAYVLQPLAELRPNQFHPENGICYRELWSDFDQSSQQLARVDFQWRGQQISAAQG